MGAAQAQQGTGALTGTVFDNATRKPLADVIVMVTSTALQVEQVTTTDASGFYRVPGLPPGSYKIRFEKEGYFPNEQDGIALRADVTFRLNPSLAVAQGEATDVVVKVRPTVDVGSSTSGTTMDADFLKRVPVSAPGSKGAASRSFESVASVAAGTSGDQYGTGINGASSPENHYAVDGLSVGNPGKGTVGTQLSTEFVQQVDVVTSGYMPEFGRSTGGVLNVVTKSGSNEFHGGVFMFLSPGGLEGKRKVVGGGGMGIENPVVYDPKLSYVGDIGFDLGGPIIKDKLWFYAGFDISNTKYNIDRSFHRTLMDGTIDPNPMDTQSYVADSRMYQAMAKLTYSANADNRLTLSVMGTPVSSGGGASFNPTTGEVTPGKYSIDPATGVPEVGGGTVGTYSSQAHQYTSTPLDISLKWNSQFLQKRLLVDVTLGHHNQVDSRRPADGSTASDIGKQYLGYYYNVNYRRGEDAMRDGMVVGHHDIREFEKFAGAAKCDQDGASCKVADYVAGSPRDLSDAKYKRYAGSAIVSYLMSAAGHHIFKAGMDGEMTVYDNVKSNRVFAENEDGTQFNDEERFGILTAPDVFQPIDPLHKQTKSMVVGGFLQDSWSVLDKVTLNLGFRYDAQYFYNTAGEVALSLPNQWSPRLGIIYDFTQSGKSKVFFNYARYYENAPLDFADVALSGEPQTRGGHACTLEGDTVFTNQHSTAAGGCQNPDTGLVANDEGEVRLPNKVYVSGGAPGTLDPDIQASSQDEISAGGEYELFPDARIGLTYTRRWINRWVEDMAPVIGLSGFNGNPGYGLGASFPKVKRQYDAFTLALSKTFSNSWLAQASYTLAFLKGNYAGLIAPEDGYLGPNATADFDSPNVAINRDGWLQGDSRHTIKAFASKDWTILPSQHLGTGVAARARSGGPTNYLAGDPNTYPMETYLVSRGSGPRMPWTFGVDLQLSYRIGMAKGISVAITADVFNVLNLQGVVSRDQEYTTDSVIAKDGTKVSDLNALTNADGNPIEKKASWNTDTGYQDPRVFRFGVRGEF